MSLFHFCPKSSKWWFYVMMQYQLVLPLCQAVPTRHPTFPFKKKIKKASMNADHLISCLKPAHQIPHVRVRATQTHKELRPASLQTTNTRNAIDGVVQ